MTATTCAILTAASPSDPSVTACLRQVVALVAGGAKPRLLLALPAEIERQLDALAEFGVGPERVDGPQLKAALEDCRYVLRAGDAGRSGEPALVTLTDALLAETDDETLLSWVRDCGQLLRTP